MEENVVFRPHQLHEIRPVVTDDRDSVCLSLSRGYAVPKWLDRSVSYCAETLGSSRHILLDEGGARIRWGL